MVICLFPCHLLPAALQKCKIELQLSEDVKCHETTWFHLQLFLSLFAAKLTVSTQVIPSKQNSTTSVTDNLKTAHYFNHNVYDRDEYRIR